jgi:hypothetical protein
VPARGFGIDPDGTFVSLMPSKWSSAPTTAVHALDALIPDPMSPTARTLAAAALLSEVEPPAVAQFQETWETVRDYAPLPALRGPSLAALRSAAALFQNEAALPHATRAVA